MTPSERLIWAAAFAADTRGGPADAEIRACEAVEHFRYRVAIAQGRKGRGTAGPAEQMLLRFAAEQTGPQPCESCGALGRLKGRDGVLRCTGCNRKVEP